MANFEVNDDIKLMIKNIESFANSEEKYKEMISAGQDIMKSAMEIGARKHIHTGKMAKSLKNTKPTQNKYGEWVGRVKFTGTDGTRKTKNGKKYDITNWFKAFRIEYGTSHQRPEPFVRPAIQNCQMDIRKKWNEIIDKELNILK